MPNRNYPGVLIQGDSLHILLALAQKIRDRASEVSETATSADDETLYELSKELHTLLSGYIHIYEQTLALHNHPLPYSVTPVDE
jgi:hypothetical protein